VTQPTLSAKKISAVSLSTLAIAFSLSAHTAYAQQPVNGLGVYVGNANGSSAPAEASFETAYNSFSSAMGTKPTLLTVFVDYTKPISAWASNASWAAWSDAQSPAVKSLEPVVAVPLYSTAPGAGTPDSQFQAIADGTYDSQFTGILAAFHAYTPAGVIVRLGWEMNLNGTPYYVGSDSQSQADWVAAFQHVSVLMHRYATANGIAFKIAFNPGITNYSAAHATTTLYPGDSYVDIIAADVYGDIYPYSDGGNPATYHDWDTGKEDTNLAIWLADPINRMHFWSYPAATEWSLDSSGGNALSLLQLIAFAEGHKKLFMIPETGAGNCNGQHDVCDDAAFPKWLGGVVASAKSNGLSVRSVNVWDSNGGGNYEFSSANDQKPNEMAAWREFFGVPAPSTGH